MAAIGGSNATKRQGREFEELVPTKRTRKLTLPDVERFKNDWRKKGVRSPSSRDEGSPREGVSPVPIGCVERMKAEHLRLKEELAGVAHLSDAQLAASNHGLLMKRKMYEASMAKLRELSENFKKNSFIPPGN